MILKQKLRLSGPDRLVWISWSESESFGLSGQTEVLKCFWWTASLSFQDRVHVWLYVSVAVLNGPGGKVSAESNPPLPPPLKPGQTDAVQHLEPAVPLQLLTRWLNFIRKTDFGCNCKTIKILKKVKEYVHFWQQLKPEFCEGRE